MTVLNDFDRFHLVMDVIDRLPQTGSTDVYLKQQMQNRLIEHKRHIRRFRQDMPEVRKTLTISHQSWCGQFRLLRVSLVT